MKTFLKENSYFHSSLHLQNNHPKPTEEKGIKVTQMKTQKLTKHGWENKHGQGSKNVKSLDKNHDEGGILKEEEGICAESEKTISEYPIVY